MAIDRRDHDDRFGAGSARADAEPTASNDPSEEPTISMTASSLSPVVDRPGFAGLPSITMIAPVGAGPASQREPVSDRGPTANVHANAVAAPTSLRVLPPRWWAPYLAVCAALSVAALVVEWIAYRQLGTVWPF